MVLRWLLDPLPDVVTVLAVLAMICENCEQEYDPVATRWRCPHCGWKASCCEGEPLPASMTADDVRRIMDDDTIPLREYEQCEKCGGSKVRFQGGLWEHECSDERDEDPQAQLPLTQETIYVPWIDPLPSNRTKPVHPSTDFL